MSGNDETTIIHECPKCGETSYHVRRQRRRTYGGLYEYEFGVFRYYRDNQRNALFLITPGVLEGKTIEEFVHSLKKKNGLLIYGFRCRSCNYLFTKRRLKKHYLDLLDGIQSCLRRNQIIVQGRYGLSS